LTNVEGGDKVKSKAEGKAQGRFTASYLLSIGVLASTDLARPIFKRTVFYFIESDEGSFNVKVVYTEKSNKYLCFSGRPLEA
jgi:putative AlgH/UPF0301 family transcriptional regulator